ncbi:MAG: hypothetical protein LPK18_02480 [Pseudomonadaceae bacterium]|nr:hypothetical protein [Pseudomonadaceae bacterium]
MDTLLYELFDRFLSRLFYSVGWLLLRLLTLGRYPRLPLIDTAPIGPRASWVTAFGLLSLLGIPLATLALLYG